MPLPAYPETNCSHCLYYIQVKMLDVDDSPPFLCKGVSTSLPLNMDAPLLSTPNLPKYLLDL